MGKNTKKNDGTEEYVLTEREFNYLKILNTALTFHTLQQKIISGFLYHVCNTRFGYAEDLNLIFEIDLDKDDRVLKVRELPNEAIEQELRKAM